MSLRNFSDDQLRTALNLSQHYDVWIEAERALRRMPYGMRWATRNGKDYLYEVMDRVNNSKSLGPRSKETEDSFANYTDQKTLLKERIAQSRNRLEETARIYRALRMPMLTSEAAKILREADAREMLGTCLLVVGTNAMHAYSLEAGGRIEAPDETDDFDMTWVNPNPDRNKSTIFDMLKSVDSTYTMNTERNSQARKAKAYEFELLAAPSTIQGMSKNEKPIPIPLPEQEWLLKGRPVTHVVVARDATPAKIVAPDPRWFALQKLWMSEKPERNPLKKPKDLKQGMTLLNVIADHMPHYPLNEEFQLELQDDLQVHFDRWKGQYVDNRRLEW